MVRKNLFSPQYLTILLALALASCVSAPKEAPPVKRAIASIVPANPGERLVSFLISPNSDGGKFEVFMLSSKADIEKFYPNAPLKKGDHLPWTKESGAVRLAMNKTAQTNTYATFSLPSGPRTFAFLVSWGGLSAASSPAVEFMVFQRTLDIQKPHAYYVIEIAMDKVARVYDDNQLERRYQPFVKEVSSKVLALYESADYARQTGASSEVIAQHPQTGFIP